MSSVAMEYLYSCRTYQLHLPVSASACVVFTADEGVRGGKVIPLKKMVDEALEGCECVKKVYVYKRTGADVPMKSERDVVLDEVSLRGQS